MASLAQTGAKKNPNSRIHTDLNSRIPTDFKPPFGIPNSWAWVKLGDICEIILGQSPNSNEIINLNSSQNYLEFHQGKIYFTDKIISKSNQAVKIANKTAQENSILLCVRAPVGIVNITDRKLAIGRGLCSIKPKKDNLFFIFFALQSLKYIFDDKATGTTFKAVTGQIVKEFYIPLPPLDEQEFIVNELERLMSLADSYEVEFQKLENCKKELRNLKKSLLNYAISGKLSANWRKENPNSRIPNDLNSRIPTDFNPPFEIPNSWAWVKLGDLGDIITGSTPPKANKEFYGDDYPFYKPSDLDAGIQVENSADTISKKGFEASRKLPQNSILVTCIGATIGKTGLIHKEGICNQQINAILPNEKFISKFLFFAITSEFFQNEIKQNSSSTTLPILNKSKFSNLYIPLPPLDEQERIVKKIDELFEILEVIENSL